MVILKHILEASEGNHIAKWAILRNLDTWRRMTCLQIFIQRDDTIEHFGALNFYIRRGGNQINPLKMFRMQGINVAHMGCGNLFPIRQALNLFKLHLPGRESLFALAPFDIGVNHNRSHVLIRDVLVKGLAREDWNYVQKL